MNVHRQHVWFALLAVVLMGLGALTWTRSMRTQPYARPVPSSKWTSATTEPDLRVYRAESGTIETMKFEKYIEGVVAAEMDPSWPLEALKAQAVVARTFTIEELDRREGVASKHPGADVSTDPEEFQAYNASRVTENVRRAVRDTRGEIITYQGKPVRAWFHADSGGRTALPEEGLGPVATAGAGRPPYLRVVRVPWTAADSDWTATFSREEVRAAAIRAGKDPGAFTTIAVGRKGPSGRVIDIRLGQVSVPAPELRLALGRTRLKSTLITAITMTGDQVTVKGRGDGHGVGMGQWAARTMASQGRSYRNIIDFFYRGVAIARLWS